MILDKNKIFQFMKENRRKVKYLSTVGGIIEANGIETA